jgi:hypothetical protein
MQLPVVFGLMKKVKRVVVAVEMVAEQVGQVMQDAIMQRNGRVVFVNLKNL